MKKESLFELILFAVVSCVTFVLGILILVGYLTVRTEFPLLAENPDTFAWILVSISGMGMIYAGYKIKNYLKKDK